MRLRTDLQCMLLDWEYTEEGNDTLPYFRNFLTYTEKCRDRSYWHFLFFLNSEIKDFKKKRNLESFQEFLDNRYPPKEKTPTEE